MIVIDLPDMDQKLKVGSEIFINYGKVQLKVKKIESEEIYLMRAQC
jgi:pyruvate kinase